VYIVLRRLAALLLLSLPVSVIGFGDATWGASRVRPLPRREAHALSMSALPTEHAAEDRAESAVILVVLDGVRWQEVFEGADRTLARQRHINTPSWSTPRGLMPNLYALIDGDGASGESGEHGLAIGAPGHGEEISATGPQFISMPGYIEIFGGKPDFRCYRNDCIPAPMRTLVDEVRDSSGAGDVSLVASWPNIARAASTGEAGFVLSAGRKLVQREEALRADPATAALLDEASRAGPWPGEGDYRRDAFTARIALRRLVVGRPRFLFVGLGDADEYAHRNNYRGYLDAMREADAFLGDVMTALRTMGARGQHTTLLVTSDHGRAHDFVDHGRQFPESGRVWLVAGGNDVVGRGFMATSRRHTLSDVAPTVLALLGIANGDAAPISEIVGPIRAD
jgi:phosphopentomutase/2,3-bisphosphoglycerate-independent phosphoglycerate mutase family metalloenzyme